MYRNNSRIKNIVIYFNVKKGKKYGRKEETGDIMAENIERFKAEYMKAIESGLSERLKGVPPKISREKENLTDPFLSGLGM